MSRVEPQTDEIPAQGIRDEYEQLTEDVRRYRYAYYNEDSPLVSDAEFDQLYRRLEEIEALHPELVANDSPTQEVGGEVSAAFAPVEHLQRMDIVREVTSVMRVEGGAE